MVGACSNGWIKNPLAGSESCYKFVVDHKATWNKAQSMCHDLGGYLAILESKEEIVWIRGYRSFHLTLRDAMHIGGYLKDGKWLWKGDLEEYPIMFTDWATGEPSGTGPCLTLFGDNYGDPFHQWFRFDDGHCDFKTHFICEKKE